MSNSQLAKAAEYAQQKLSNTSLSSALMGLATVVDKVVSYGVSPLDKMFEGCDCIKIVKDFNTLRRVGPGVIYEVMDFNLKAYKYGRNETHKRVAGCLTTRMLDDVRFNGQPFESIALTVTDNGTRFNKVRKSGLITIVSEDLECDTPAVVYTTKVSPDTLRFLVLSDKAALVEEVEQKVSRKQAKELKEMYSYDVDDVDLTNETTHMFAEV